MAILGIDEVGRGPLAGPLVVGAVVLPENKSELSWVAELKDSKKLTAKKREKLSAIIWEEAAACGLGWVSAEELNQVGIVEGLRLAARRAVEEVQKKHAKFSEIVIDGNMNFLEETALGGYVTTVVKGDDLIKEISAASIIAKVARDNYMRELGERYPEYSFGQHVGYGTKKHLEELKTFGACPEHRLFCEPVARAAGVPTLRFDKEKKNTTAVGTRGEEAVCNYLRNEMGHEILAQNFKTRFCEIDVVSREGDTIYFTEVKTRKDGGGVHAVGAKKLEKMQFAVEVFLKMHPGLKVCNPMLAVAAVDGDYHVQDWFPLSDFVV